MAIAKKRFRLIAVEVTGDDAATAIRLLGRAVEMAKVIGSDGTNTTVQITAPTAKAKITVHQEGA